MYKIPNEKTAKSMMDIISLEKRKAIIQHLFTGKPCFIRDPNSFRVKNVKNLHFVS